MLSGKINNKVVWNDIEADLLDDGWHVYAPVRRITAKARNDQLGQQGKFASLKGKVRDKQS